MENIILRLSYSDALDLLAEMGRERDTDMRHYAPGRLALRGALRAAVEAAPDAALAGDQEYRSWG